ncbi:hypothetical protein CPC08DRAFT_822298 [Agrocybe pediades]|nr:hypothetical protein CPC08DRAFT_822298 [Agrocybe pediades]
MLAIRVFYSAILSLFFFSSGVWTTPLPVPRTVDGDVLLSRNHPPIPSLAEMETHLHVPADASLFYSCDQLGQGTCKQAKTWAKTNHPTYKVLGQMWTNSNYPTPWQADPAVSKQFFDVASQAMAELSSGTVYVVLGPWTHADGKDWYDQSVWARMEWPALEANHNVKTIYRVNAATGVTIKIKG